MNTHFSKRTHPSAIICIHVWSLCLSLGPWEIWCFILQCINHHRPHRPGKLVHWGFTQGRHRKYHLIQPISDHLNVSSLFEQVIEFTDWVKAPFVFSFLMSCFMGYVAIVFSNLLIVFEWPPGTDSASNATCAIFKVPVCVFKVCSDVFHRPV